MKLRRNGQPDGRSKRATFQTWLREHAPLVHIGLYSEPGEQLEALAKRLVICPSARTRLPHSGQRKRGRIIAPGG